MPDSPAPAARTISTMSRGLLLLVMPLALGSCLRAAQVQRSAAPPRWTVHLDRVDYGAVVRLNGEPVFIARAGNEVSGSITPIAGNNELTIEFEVAYSSDRGSYGYRVCSDRCYGDRS